MCTDPLDVHRRCARLLTVALILLAPTLASMNFLYATGVVDFEYFLHLIENDADFEVTGQIISTHTKHPGILIQS
jgi:hypothetical protein